MKKLIYSLAALAMLSSCIQEFAPQSGSVTSEQAANAPGAFDNFVDAITSNISGQFTLSYQQPNDFGLTSFYLQWDAMGQDMACINNNWFSNWYQCGAGLAPIYANCQYPWSYFFTMVQNCNAVLRLAGDTPSEQHIVGTGIAYFWRSYAYLMMGQMFAPETYGVNPQAPTVPIVTQELNLNEAAENPRATSEDLFKLILADLDKAETALTGYKRSAKNEPDVSCVNALRARTYLLMCDWANAEKYAKLAAEGYTVMTAEQYTDRTNGFNNANSNNAWILSCGFKSSDPAITYNDGDSSWGTWMICEFPAGSDGLGYLNSYGGANIIDRHLYETIPATDCRKKCFLDFAIDDLETAEEVIEALSAYSDVPENVYGTGLCQGQWGGIPMKFRSANGNHETNQVGYCVDVPVIRVEEMKLIEAEAAGMQDESRGKALLEAFAKTRDPQYEYGKHQEKYNSSYATSFQNEIWWQRRAEFWGEGLATLDIKRLCKGIIRSYPGTDHVDGYRWNTTGVPDWMNLCIVQTETNYNPAIVNNPTPVAPTGNSPEVTSF